MSAFLVNQHIERCLEYNNRDELERLLELYMDPDSNVNNILLDILESRIYFNAVMFSNLDTIKTFFRFLRAISKSECYRDSVSKTLDRYGYDLLKVAVTDRTYDVVTYLIDDVGLTPYLEEVMVNPYWLHSSDMRITAKFLESISREYEKVNTLFTFDDLPLFFKEYLVEYIHLWFTLSEKDCGNLFSPEIIRYLYGKLQRDFLIGVLKYSTIETVRKVFKEIHISEKEGCTLLMECIEECHLKVAIYMLDQYGMQSESSADVLLEQSLLNTDMRVTAVIYEYFKNHCTYAQNLQITDYENFNIYKYLSLDKVHFEKLRSADVIENIASKYPLIYYQIARYSNIEILKTVMQILTTLYGRKTLLKNLSRCRDESDDGEDFLTTILRYQVNVSAELLEEIITEYNLDVNALSDNSKCFALTYALQNNNILLSLVLLKRMDIEKFKYSKLQKLKEIISNGLVHRLEKIDLREKSIRIEWQNALSTKIPELTQDVLLSKIFLGEIQRQKNTSYTKRRCQQIMRHIATQLYMRWKCKLNLPVTDVQIMSVFSPNEFPSLFIVYTPYVINGNAIKNDFEETEFKDMVTTIYNPTHVNHICRNGEIKYEQNGSITKEYETRSRRYSRKLKETVWPKLFDSTTRDYDLLDEFSKLHFKQLLNLLDTHDKYTEHQNSKYMLNKFEYKKRTIYLLPPSTDTSPSERHAEEYLCDVADNIILQSKRRTNALSADTQLASYIFGKTRPCMGCCGRMASSKIDYYNKHCGYLCTHGIEDQTQEAARNTLGLLLTEQPHVSYGEELNGYDTASDSESDPTESSWTEQPNVSYSEKLNGYDTAEDSETDPTERSLTEQPNGTYGEELNGYDTAEVSETDPTERSLTEQPNVSYGEELNGYDTAEDSETDPTERSLTEQPNVSYGVELNGYDSDSDSESDPAKSSFTEQSHVSYWTKLNGYDTTSDSESDPAEIAYTDKSYTDESSYTEEGYMLI